MNVSLGGVTSAIRNYKNVAISYYLPIQKNYADWYMLIPENNSVTLQAAH